MFSYFKRWFTFMKERFEPLSTSLMIFSLTAANVMMAYIWEPNSTFIYSWKRLTGGYILIWLVFFHMRLFDEVKDYDTDCKVNKDRPLPRGLITLEEIGFLTLLCFMVEGIIAWNLRFPVFTTYLAIATFTLLMRMEFFVGKWLSPKMELYAITHTFSASIMGLVTFSVLTNKFMNEIPYAYLYIALGNWFVFNVFEFGRKTFGKEEERENVDSYSLRLEPSGAVILLFINLALAYMMLYLSSQQIAIHRFNGTIPSVLKELLYWVLIPYFLVLISGIIYGFKNSIFTAKLYRGVVSLYLLFYHAIIAIYGYLYFIK